MMPLLNKPLVNGVNLRDKNLSQNSAGLIKDLDDGIILIPINAGVLYVLPFIKVNANLFWMSIFNVNI